MQGGTKEVKNSAFEIPSSCTEGSGAPAEQRIGNRYTHMRWVVPIHRSAGARRGVVRYSLWSPVGSALMDLSELSLSGVTLSLPSCFAFRWIFFIFARWFWNHTWTTRTESPVSLANASRTFLHGLGLTSNDALNCLLWAEVRIVRGRLGPRRPSRGREFSSKRSSSEKLKVERHYFSVK